MRTAALAGGRDDFAPSMGRQEREHCRVDLDKVTSGAMTADAFVAKWREALRATLVKA